MNAIGIDLGTTFSCIAYLDKNKNLEIIENKFTGNRITPSVCSFSESDLKVGRPSRVSENAIYEIKRLIGLNFDNPQVQNDIKNWSFKVTGNNNKPQIHVKYKDQDRVFCPEEISAIILYELKKIAALHFGQDKNDKINAVITVPAYFNDSQRQATIDAAKIAGFEVLKIIPEPTAAALAYGYHRKLEAKSKILIFDLGGGTFDVSIMEIDNGNFRVLAIDGDVHLGGADFDNRLVDYFVQAFKQKFKIDLSTNKRALLRLRTRSEQAKRDLTQVFKTTIEIDALYDGHDFEQTIDRETFEKLNKDLFDRTIEIVQSALKSANLDKSQIDDIVLVGGSSRIPKIKSMLQEFFKGKTLKQDINADEVVAYGAGIQAALLTGTLNTGIKEVIDVIPKSIGVKNNDGSLCVYFKKNSRIPNVSIGRRSTVEDNQTFMRFRIFEGEDPTADKNNFLGEFLLENITVGPVGKARVEMAFNINTDGILHITAKDLDTLSSNDLKISFLKNRLTEQEINKMTNDMDELFK